MSIQEDDGSDAVAAPLPRRIRLSRRKGWRLPANTVVVGRPTPWGNPFKVDVDGNADRSVELYRILLTGHICVSCTTDPDAQQKTLTYVRKNFRKLRGKQLACWCALNKPCHADVLLEIANATKGAA